MRLRDAARGHQESPLPISTYLEARGEGARTAGQVHYGRGRGGGRAKSYCRSPQFRGEDRHKGKSMVARRSASTSIRGRKNRTVGPISASNISSFANEPPRHIIRAEPYTSPRTRSKPDSRCPQNCPRTRDLTEPQALISEARGCCGQLSCRRRRHTGANFLVAKPEPRWIVTKEGNGDLTQTLPRV